MSKKNITKREIAAVMKLAGKARGVVFVEDREYLLSKEGEEALKKVEEATREMGYPIDYAGIKPLEWYPLGLWIVHLLAVKQALNWGDKDIFAMGNAAPKFSIVVKMLLKYFVSLKQSYNQAPHYWRKHFTVGKITLPKFHEEDKWLIVRLEDVKLHPIACALLAGYFLRIGQYVIKSRHITIEEVKCMHRGDPYHDFLFKWQ